MDFNPQHLYLLILNAESLTDEQKQKYIDRFNREGITDELAKELTEIFEKEEKRLGNYIDQKKKELVEEKAKLKAEKHETQPAVNKLLEDTEDQLKEADAEYGRKLQQEVEIPFDKEIESIQKTDEQNKIAAIRNKLKTPPKTS